MESSPRGTNVFTQGEEIMLLSAYDTPHVYDI